MNAWDNPVRGKDNERKQDKTENSVASHGSRSQGGSRRNPAISDQLPELLPCPFCGGPAGCIPDTSYGSCVVGCGDEECFGAARAFDVADFEHSMKAWNTRTEIAHNGRTAAEWYSLYCHEVAKCNRLQEELKTRVSVRELAESVGMEVDGIRGEDIDVLTGKRMHVEE